MSTQASVAILGAGAMGAAYASLFHTADGTRVTLVAADERAERLRREGLVVNGTPYRLPVVTPDEPTPPADLILVAPKHHHLPAAVHDLRHLVGDETLILSVMNGLDSEPILADVYGWEHVLYAIAVGIDAQRQGNVIHFSKLGTIFFGEAENSTLSDRVRRVQAILDAAGVPHSTPPDMIRTLWWKFMVNVGINQASAVLGAPYGVFQTSPHAQAIMEAAMREVVTLARLEGVNLGPEDIDEWYTVLATLHPQGQTSMLQDIVAGRPTEVDIFAGKIIALGQQHGIHTPVNMLLFHAIKVLEQREPSGEYAIPPQESHG